MDSNQDAYEQRSRFGMALELQRLSDEVSRLTENQLLQDSATAAVMERAEKAEAELSALRSQPQGEPVCPNCISPWKCNGPHITEREAMSEYWTAPLVPEAELAALRAELTEQCRLNGMGQEREARLMAQLQEAERKLKRICKCEFSSGGVLKKSCEYHNQREKVAERKLAALMKEGGE